MSQVQTLKPLHTIHIETKTARSEAASATEMAKLAAGVAKTAGWTPDYAEKMQLQLLGKDYKWTFHDKKSKRKLHNLARNVGYRLQQFGLTLDIPMSYVKASTCRSMIIYRFTTRIRVVCMGRQAHP